MWTEQDIERRIGRNQRLSNHNPGWSMTYRDFVISIADGDVEEDDIVPFCRRLVQAELLQAHNRVALMSEVIGGEV